MFSKRRSSARQGSAGGRSSWLKSIGSLRPPPCDNGFAARRKRTDRRITELSGPDGPWESFGGIRATPPSPQKLRQIPQIVRNGPRRIPERMRSVLPITGQRSPLPILSHVPPNNTPDGGLRMGAGGLTWDCLQKRKSLERHAESLRNPTVACHGARVPVKSPKSQRPRARSALSCGSKLAGFGRLLGSVFKARQLTSSRPGGA